VAPRETLVLHGGVDLPGEDPAKVWAITCFHVKSALRGAGIMKRLIEEAAAHARSGGGASLEAYPVVPDSPSYRFCGFTTVFEKHGFVEVGRAGLRRHVMRRALV
jgi:GNAT superfamily N-acetyltransferase